jgi:[histone H3]-lysine9 N-trimethyltransferase SUV39H
LDIISLASFTAITNVTSNIAYYLTSPFTYFSDVISLAEPNAPRVEIINEVDGEKPPVGWWYSNEMWLGPGVLSSTWEGVGGCGCVPGTGCASRKGGNVNWFVDKIGGSGSRSGSVAGTAGEGEGHGNGDGNGNGGVGSGCSCLRRQQAWSKDSIAAFAYKERGVLQEKYVPVWECGVGCGCGEGCRNRVVQKGRKINIRIQKTEKYGWGMYAFAFFVLSPSTWNC